jgi:hypothetical protein
MNQLNALSNRSSTMARLTFVERLREVLQALTEAEVAQGILVVERDRVRRRRLPIGE